MRVLWILVLALGIVATPALARDHGDRQTLPPGLQKKKHDALPPGWQKKLARGAILDREVYRKCVRAYPADAHGIITVQVDGRIIRLVEATREIVEILK